jgi:hypothetical protein
VFEGPSIMKVKLNINEWWLIKRRKWMGI